MLDDIATGDRRHDDATGHALVCGNSTSQIIRRPRSEGSVRSAGLPSEDGGAMPPTPNRPTPPLAHAGLNPSEWSSGLTEALEKDHPARTRRAEPRHPGLFPYGTMPQNRVSTNTGQLRVRAMA